MALAAGARLGPYEVVSLLGSGGMGEVYRARDARLGRDVAIKVVAGGLVDADRLARFEQEARAAAALNHPHILAVHDVGTADVHGVSTPYVVSELLEGESLRDRVTRGKLPARVATELAVQIARALASAHEHGIVHRDIKPENVFVTKDGAAKVLDFGLAKLRDVPVPGATGATTATGAHVGTGPGVVLGTVGYMAPEQVRGEPVGHRADIFALGCVLYELVTGQRAFQASTAVETLSAILNHEPPDFATHVAGISGGLERMVRRCLEKDPGQRFQSARDLAFALEAVSDARSSSVTQTPVTGAKQPRWREAIAWGAVAAMAGWMIAGRTAEPPPDPEPQTMRLDVDMSEAGTIPAGGTFPRISPDGRTFVVRLARGGVRRLVSRRSDDPAALREIPGTESAIGGGWWSPDSTSLVFRAGPGFRLVEVDTGAAPIVVPTTGMSVGAGISVSWGTSGSLLVVDTRRRLFLVPARGGQPQAMSLSLPARQRPAWAEFLPDGRRFLLTTVSDERPALYIGELGVDTVRLVADGVEGRVLFVAPNYVMWRRQGILVAQRMDLDRATMVGEPVPLAPVPANQFSASKNLLAYASSTAQSSRLVWYDRRTSTTRTVGAPSRYMTFNLSRDGHAIVASVADADGQSLWVVDAELGGLTRLTSGAAQDVDPRWSPDGQAVAFASTRTAGRGPHRFDMRGQVTTTFFQHSGALFSLDDWSADGQWLVYHDASVPELFARRTDGSAEPVPVARSISGTVNQARMSPDSSQVAFNSNDSGRYEVFAVPFPPTGQRVRISRDGGVQPTWRADGRELFFLALDGTLMAVPVTPGSPTTFGTPKALFKLGSEQLADATLDTYLPAPDGQRFLSLQPTAEEPRAIFSVIVNWQQLLKPPGTTP